jgi:hypothetical protein
MICTFLIIISTAVWPEMASPSKGIPVLMNGFEFVIMHPSVTDMNLGFSIHYNLVVFLIQKYGKEGVTAIEEELRT